MEIVLIPGMWLDGSAWDPVIPALERSGHRTHPITLPGMESKTADRSGISLRDHIDAVVGVIDALDPAAGKVVVVGHSMGGVLAHAAADARPERVARVVYVGSEPRGDSEAGEWPGETKNGEIPLPEWSFFDEEMVADLDDELRATMRERAIPWPERVCTDPLRLTDDRRFDVPTTMITCEYSTAQLQEWMEQRAPGTEELVRLRDVEYIDLGTGHWPQFTNPAELARVLLGCIDRS